MPLSRFHPAVAHWFTSTLGEPTLAQTQGWKAIRDRRHTLIAAPTGSGKTLAAFLSALDDLFNEGLDHELPDEIRVLYVSPLKALSADIHKNLAEPRTGIRLAAKALGLEAPRITAAVRTGDTSPADRAAMLRTPPHVLVTTPESLYLLLTAERSRQLLRTVRTVIVDEIHAVIGTRRGAHLALSLERLARLTASPPQRIGLSATQRPIAEVARFLVGTTAVDPAGTPDCVIVDEGHRRALDLGLEIPGSALEAVMSHEVWEEYYDRLADLIGQHKTTIVFVNTRRLAERVARHLSERLGDEAVTAHHGSLSKEKRLDAEERLKTGKLRGLVATASLELGIDIGHVDLVCQLGSPRLVSTFLQRVGRSGHTVRGTPKGRLFPMSRDDLVECAALLRAVRRGELDLLTSTNGSLDVLAQQIAAETACEDYQEEALFDLARQAYPYRALARSDFDAVVTMLADGFATRRGRRGALVHQDLVNGRVRGRRGARLAAITSGGAIPENADYRVVLEPEDTFIGTLNEDFAIESMAGDVFQLGNSSWRVLQVAAGTVRVADARGEPPNIPFWVGEAPGRSDELSAGVSHLRREIETRLEQRDGAIGWLVAESGVASPAAEQIVDYLTEARRMLGALPTQQTIVLERFFDESGGMQLVLHAPFGSRVNRAWGLALRKRFCRQFNFELQAAATEEGLLLSLGPQHSFPLEDVFRYLHPATVRTILVQACLDAPVFQTRWRWNTTVSLAVLRNRGGKKVPPQLQRMQADDLMAAVFPDAAACLENIAGDREIPDHPLVNQTIQDCLEEAMDLPRLMAILEKIHGGEIHCLARDMPEPSPLCSEIVSARVYGFLDDAPLEERRAQAVYSRRATEPAASNDLGALDRDAIQRVREEAWPDPRDDDELHDALLTAGFLEEARIGPADEAGGAEETLRWHELFDQLRGGRRAARLRIGGAWLWVAAERLPELKVVCPTPDGTASIDPPIEPPPRVAQRRWDRAEAIRELLRGRMAILGPVTVPELARPLALGHEETEGALLALEQKGTVLRGFFTPGGADREWCDRRLLARIHRYTLNRLRAEIEPVTVADFVRFLFLWQRLDPATRVSGQEGLRAVIEQFDGYELPAVAWEADVLPGRMTDYDPGMLDILSLTGRVAWARLSIPSRPGFDPSPVGPIRSTPIALMIREHLGAWLAGGAGDTRIGDAARQVLEALRHRGASFFEELASACAMAPSEIERCLGELAAAGLVTSDSFAGLRVLVTPVERRQMLQVARPGRARTVAGSLQAAGRWSILPREPAPATGADPELQARALLRRYGVMFRRLLVRESCAATWRELTAVYRRLEARGEIRGGRFVAGMSGEQFALPEAVGQLRNVRRSPATGRLLAISAADPLNLTGIVTSGPRVASVASSRVVYQDGVALAALEGDFLRPLSDYDPGLAAQVNLALTKRPVPPVLRGYIGRSRASGASRATM